MASGCSNHRFILGSGRKVSRVPSRIQALVETVVEGAMKLADSVTGARSKTIKVFPFIFALFLFVLINNWLGLIPGVGSIGFIEMIEGHKVFVPLFRGATADFNTTLALAIMSVVGSNIFGVIVVGAFKYFNKFVQVKELVSIPSEIIKNPAVIFVNPIKFFVGLIEIVGEIAKVASLSFRLFGNIFAGEVLLTSIAVIFALACRFRLCFGSDCGDNSGTDFCDADFGVFYSRRYSRRTLICLLVVCLTAT